ncbi:MAG: phospholipid carrier-dependent glycosyltransferase [Planctomycetaceae bacterium]|nr:phospholipid carrier-dependent glycosyltransferase [Planctomycetaceae bacterium]MBT6485180.1 phospholipid carrier-dependent glycosyltransferase [Planctomycetaceae bacterium]MBT6497135.1 phospholipid carrier-dependent glycosyltransferase [Planctomycetaceae bacterium]
MASHEELNNAIPPARTSRRELALLFGIVILAAVLRFAFPSRMAIEHFDEGVYASNIWFSEEADFRYPARHLYGPPLLPAFIEWSIILFGLGTLSAKLASLVAGTATIAVVWWVARRWFGAEAGIAAASLAALSDFHILYSRAALTDVMMCLWLLIAVGSVREMFASDRHRWAITAGLATGLAWATKYNGWLPLAIAGSGFVLFLLISRWKKQVTTEPRMGCVISLIAMALTAAVVWSPVLLDLNNRGGYAAVAANHRGYFGGLSDWLPSLFRQIDNHRYLEGWLSCGALVLAIVAAVVVRHWTARGFTWNESKASKAEIGSVPRQHATGGRTNWGVVAAILLLTIASAVSLGSSMTIGVLTVAVIGVRLLGRSKCDETTLPFCLLAVWFCGLSIATPFYFPYPRLTLPWLVAAWLGGGAMIGWTVRKIVDNNGGTATEKQKHPWWILVGSAVLFCGAVFLGANRWTERGIPGWQSQTGLKEVAGDIAVQVDSESSGRDALILVYAEPGLFFQLAVAGGDSQRAAIPIGALIPPTESPTTPTYLVTGPNAHRAPNYNAAISAFGDRLQLAAEYAYRPSDLVLLNWSSPSDPVFPGPKQRVRLYRLR